MAVLQVTLVSSDSQDYTVTEEVAFMSETVKNTLEGACLAVCLQVRSRVFPSYWLRTGLSAGQS